MLANADLYQKVKDEQDHNSAILENIADGIVAVDREGTVVLWNAAAEQITGVPAAEAIGRTPLSASADLDRPSRGATRDRRVSIHRGGEGLAVGQRGRDAGSDGSGCRAHLRLQGRLRRARRRGDEVGIRRRRLARAAHPATSIYGFAETLLRQDVLFEEEAPNVPRLYRIRGSAPDRIVDALLNVARLDAGDLQMFAPIDVRSVVSRW